MQYEDFTATTVAEAVALTNLFARAVPASEDEVRQILHLYGLREGPLDVAAFEALAERLRGVFEASDPAARVRSLNELMTAHGPSPHIADHDGQGPHFHYVRGGGADVHRVGASLVMALAHVVVDVGPDRLGTCAAPGCRNVFVDRTRNRSQRFCSRTCSTRVHVAAHRARR